MAATSGATALHSNVTGLFDAIRSKAGASGSMTFAQAASAVEGIESGGGGGGYFDALVEGTLTEVEGGCSMIFDFKFACHAALTTASFPACSNIGGSAFLNCTSLSDASFPACSYIAGYAFSGCCSLVSLYLLGSSVPTLGSVTAFSSTPLFNYSQSAGKWGSIYVRESLYNSFIKASNWSNASIKARIVSLTDAQIAALG